MNREEKQSFIDAKFAHLVEIESDETFVPIAHSYDYLRTLASLSAQLCGVDFCIKQEGKFFFWDTKDAPALFFEPYDRTMETLRNLENQRDEIYVIFVYDLFEDLALEEKLRAVSNGCSLSITNGEGEIEASLVYASRVLKYAFPVKDVAAKDGKTIKRYAINRNYDAISIIAGMDKHTEICLRFSLKDENSPLTERTILCI